MEHRICKRCKNKKDIIDFPLLKQGTYRGINCNECYLQSHRERRVRDIDRYTKTAMIYREKLNSMSERICSLCNINKKKEDFPSGQKNCRQCMAYRMATRKDKKRGHNTSTLEEWNNLFASKECLYCHTTNSLTADRIDNNKGHEFNNMVLACDSCNRVRADRYTVEEMKQFIGPAIAKIHESRKQIN